MKQSFNISLWMRRICLIFKCMVFVSLTAAAGNPSRYPVIEIHNNATGTIVLCDNELLLQVKDNRFLRFRSTPRDANWVGSEKSPADLGWVYADQGAKGMEVLEVKHQNNPEKGHFTLWIQGKKPQFDSKINIILTGIWMPRTQKFKYTLNTRLACELEDWYANAKKRNLTEVLDYCIEGISIPERLMAPDKTDRNNPPRYEWFVKSHDGKNWKKWPKIYIPYPVRSGDYITIRQRDDPSKVGSLFGFLDMTHGGWLTRVNYTPAPVLHELCWARFDVHMHLVGAIPPRGSTKDLALEFEMAFEPVEPDRAREIVKKATEIRWRDAPEYDLPLFSWENRFDKMLKDLPSEETGKQMLWWPSDYNCSRDSTVGFDDHYSLTINRIGDQKMYSGFSTASWKYPFKDVNPRGKRLRFSAMVRTEQCTGTVRLGHYSTVENSGDAFYGTGKSFSPDGTHKVKGINWNYSRSVSGTTDWTLVTLEFTEKGFASTLFLENTGAGQCWFDNVKIEELVDN